MPFSKHVLQPKEWLVNFSRLLFVIHNLVQKKRVGAEEKIKVEWLVNFPRLLFVIHNLVQKKRVGAEEKIKVTFKRFFDNLLLRYLISKRILAVIGCFGLFTKIKEGSGISLLYTLCIIFLQKCSIFKTLSCNQVATSDLLSSSKYQTICVLKFLFSKLML